MSTTCERPAEHTAARNAFTKRGSQRVRVAAAVAARHGAPCALPPQGGRARAASIDAEASLDGFLEDAYALAALATSPATLLVYEEAEVTADVRDPARLATEPYHGGIFAVARGKSEPCLAAWAARVLDELRRAAAANREGARIKRSSVRDQPLLREIIESGACIFAPLPPETLSKPTPAAIDGARYAVLNHLSRTSRLKGKRNGHGITKAHHAKLGADLLGVRGAAAKEKWWMAPRCPDLAPEREAPPLVLDCDVATTTTREVGT